MMMGVTGSDAAGVAGAGSLGVIEEEEATYKY